VALAAGDRDGHARPGRSGAAVTVTVALSRRQAAAAHRHPRLPDEQLGPISIAAQAEGSQYSASGIVLPSAGAGSSRSPSTSEFDSVVADTKIRLY